MGFILPILKAIGGFLLDQAVNLAVTVGIPYAVDWFYKNVYPKLPWWVQMFVSKNGITEFFTDLVKLINGIKSDPTLTPAEKKAQISEVKRGERKKRKEMGYRTGVVSETKGLD